jgi:glycosyltransferase involved in cell wall biosynthesis
MNKKIKVAHVIRVFSYGGAEVLLREFFKTPEFNKEITSDVFVLDHIKLGLVPEVKPHVNTIYYYKITHWKFLFEYLRFLFQIVKGKYDIVHMHLPVAGWMGIVAKLFTGKKTKFVYSEHNLVTSYSKYNYYLSGITYKWNDSIISVSHEVFDVIQKNQRGSFYKTNHPVTILNGIDTDTFHHTDRHQVNPAVSLTVGLVARFRPQKRVDRWAEVAAALHKINPSFKFLMVGDGPDDNMLREKIENLDMSGKIELPGKMSNTVDAYKRIDIFLLTSDFEGLPLAIMEAMSSGCVPVVSNVGGIKQLNIPGIGHKYDTFEPSQIATFINSYSKDPQRYLQESRAARDFVVNNYSLTKQVNEIIDLYKALLQ